MNKRQVGSRYEALAAGFLEQQGYTILMRNFRCRAGEIDLIAQKGRQISFVEVKYRKSAAYGYGAEAVDLRKQSRIIAASEYYLYQNRLYDVQRSYDIVEILGDQIRILTNCFGGF